MSTQFIPLTQLMAAKPKEEQNFLSLVMKRDLNSDGTDKFIIRNMDNDVCRKCHLEYKAKFPGQAFQIKCRGIYSEEFLTLKKEQMELMGESMSMDQIREIYDPSFWGEKHIVVKNAKGDFIPFVPRWYQKESLTCTSPRKIDRWGRGLGKAEVLDSIVFTPTGRKVFGDLKVGDKVFDADGAPTTITFITEIMYDHNCYEVVFSDGSRVVADEEHLWETWTHAARKAESRKWRRTGKLAHTRPVPKAEIRTTKQILETLFHGNGNRIEHNHSIKVCGPLQYSKKDLLIDPYVLGVWLGDGDYKGNGITSNDPEMMEELTKRGYITKKLATKYKYSIVSTPQGKPFTYLLKEIGVFGNKKVPVKYLQGDIEQRTDLLKGLMDTDGTIAADGNCCFDNTNIQLSDSVYELVISLGYKGTKSIKIVKLRGVQHKDDHRVNFTPYRPVFILSRKLNRQKLIKSRSTQWHRYIVAVNRVKSAPVRCIRVDNPRHMYLTGESCIPTHNTQNGVCEELHISLTNKNLETAIICPQQTQAEQWYLEILSQIENSPSLNDVLAGQKQSPYYLLRFNNGSIIKIFTAGSGSGKKGGSMRGQMHIRRVRIDEQDYLSEDDYGAIQPLLRRFKEVTFHGASTPTGARLTYYRMCKEFPDHKEFYHPISDHPDWNEEMKAACLREAKILDRYLHEYMAEFGSLSAGVFKNNFIEKSLYHTDHRKVKYNPANRYIMGVDWNGQGTGTRIYILEYEPSTRIRRTVERSIIDSPDSTTVESINEIKRLNKKWMCDHIYVDAGFGASQDELIRLEGKTSGKNDPQTYKLKNINKIDFGGTLDFNKLVPNRELGEKKTKKSEKEDIETRRTKPFMVEGAVMALEQGIIELSKEDDSLLIEQMRGYKVKSWSAHGTPASYETDADSGDHDLDAFMLALLGIEINYGLYHTNESIRRMAQIVHASTWGIGTSKIAGPSVSTSEPLTSTPVEQNKQQLRKKAGISSRLAQMLQQSPRVNLSMRTGAYVTPGKVNGSSTSRAIPTSNMPNRRQSSSPFNSIAAGLIFNGSRPL
jgi:hypothetical protein